MADSLVVTWASQRIRSEERRVGKECRSLCDWSSDVCSSDLWAASDGYRRYSFMVYLARNCDGLHVCLRRGKVYRAQGACWESARWLVLACLSPSAWPTLSLLPGRLSELDRKSVV